MVFARRPAPMLMPSFVRRLRGLGPRVRDLARCHHLLARELRGSASPGAISCTSPSSPAASLPFVTAKASRRVSQACHRDRAPLLGAARSDWLRSHHRFVEVSRIRSTPHAGPRCRFANRPCRERSERRRRLLVEKKGLDRWRVAGGDAHPLCRGISRVMARHEPRGRSRAHGVRTAARSTHSDGGLRCGPDPHSSRSPPKYGARHRLLLAAREGRDLARCAEPRPRRERRPVSGGSGAAPTHRQLAEQSVTGTTSLNLLHRSASHAALWLFRMSPSHSRSVGPSNDGCDLQTPTEVLMPEERTSQRRACTPTTQPGDIEIQRLSRMITRRRHQPAGVERRDGVESLPRSREGWEVPKPVPRDVRHCPGRRQPSEQGVAAAHRLAARWIGHEIGIPLRRIIAIASP